MDQRLHQLLVSMRAVAVMMLFVLSSSAARAATAPAWSPQELARFADVIVIGRVSAVVTGWDRNINAIYTFVTLDVSEVLKGDVTASRITVKQLGGAASGVVLAVTDQPTFGVGDEVLLYLEARPRDGTLYTTALWQGKWDLARGAAGEQVAVRRSPAHAKVEERRSLRDLRRWARSMASQSAAATATLDDAPVSQASAGFNLLGPYRYMHAPAVDAQAGGQPGLAGAGFAEIQSAITRWNSAGSRFRFAIGQATGTARCSTEYRGDGRVTLTFMDPCGEMSDSGGTLALGGSYYFPGEGGTVNGQLFDRAVEGFIVNNDSPIALQFLTNPGCFEEIQTHELGHVLGLHHSSDPDALMYATLSYGACSTGPRGLRADDIQGVRFIYGTGGALDSPPADVRVAVATHAVTVSWQGVAGGPASGLPISYRVDFRAGHSDTAPVVLSAHTADTRLTAAVPAGVAGPFSVVVTAITSAGAGPPSERRDFFIGPVPCSEAPGAIGAINGGVSQGVAWVRWSAVEGATEYFIQVGSTQGSADIVGPTNLGPSLGASAPVPPGFQAWVRVAAVSACGIGTPVDYFVH